MHSPPKCPSRPEKAYTQLSGLVSLFSGPLSLEELGKVAANFVEASQSGALESSLNVTLDAIVVTEPEPTPTTKPKATNESG